jgi:hypothetical protein
MKKLIEALHVIQDECAKHIKCTECPLYNGHCGLKEPYKFPGYWLINDSGDGDKALL